MARTTRVGRYDNPYAVAEWNRPLPAGTTCEPLVLETADRAIANGWLYARGGQPAETRPSSRLPTGSTRRLKRLDARPRETGSGTSRTGAAPRRDRRPRSHDPTRSRRRRPSPR